MKRKNLIRFTALLLTICLFFSFAGCKKQEQENMIRSQLADFVLCCHNMDLDGIIRCLDPIISEPIAIAIEALVFAANAQGKEFDKTKAMEIITKYVMKEDGLDAGDFFESIEVEPVRISISGSKAKVYANISYAIADIRFDKEGVITMTEQSDVWRIKWLSFEQFD